MPPERANMNTKPEDTPPPPICSDCGDVMKLIRGVPRARGDSRTPPIPAPPAGVTRLPIPGKEIILQSGFANRSLSSKAWLLKQRAPHGCEFPNFRRSSCVRPGGLPASGLSAGCINAPTVKVNLGVVGLVGHQWRKTGRATSRVHRFELSANGSQPLPGVPPPIPAYVTTPYHPCKPGSAGWVSWCLGYHLCSKFAAKML
jgi:hypothetical protein